MVVITEEINGVHLRMFKWNEKLPATTNKKGLFLLRVCDEIITVTSNENGDGTITSTEFAVHPDLITFDLCRPCQIHMSDFSILSREFFLPENSIILAKNIATNLHTYFRIKLRTLYGNRPKPVIVVEIHRKKTVDHTKEHMVDEDFEIDDLEVKERFEDKTSSEEIESADGADSDILRILKFLLGISEIEVLEQIESDEPKGLYEVKRAIVYKQLQVCDSISDGCSICLEEFSEGMQVVETPCAHNFHEHCILKWMTIQISCPICRSACVAFI